MSVRVCSPPGDPSTKNIHKREKVSYISNLLYSDFGIRTWKAYNTGPGKLIPWTKFDAPKESELPTMEVRPSTDLKASAGFVPVRPRRTSGQHPATEKDESFDSDTMSTVNSSQLFTCPEEGCVKTFRRQSSLVKHVDCGTHKRMLEHETLYDKAMIEYATKLDCGASKTPTVIEASGPSLPTAPTLMMGWALQTIQSRRTKFTDKQRQYLNAKFQICERTGNKAGPTDISKATRTAKDNNGERLFSYDDFLTSQ